MNFILCTIKPYADFYIDDRAIEFKEDWQKVLGQIQDPSQVLENKEGLVPVPWIKPQTIRHLMPCEFMNALHQLEPVGTLEWTVPIYSDEWGEPMTLEDLAGDVLNDKV